MIKTKKLFAILLFSNLIFSNGNYLLAQGTIKSVKIGTQVWMAENLNVTRFRNGDSIPEVKDQYEWRNLKTAAWCYYKNDPENGKKYGKLYNWYAVIDSRGLAPTGWHIPTRDEFLTLKNVTNDNSNVLKAIGQGSGSGAGTDTTGFSVLLSGYRGYFGYFYYLSYDAYFWSSTEGYASSFASSLYLYSSGSYLFFYDFDKVYGFSLRCLQD
jgi:uncharacterized protein (TIGR02145 family)